eukprot:123938_1
MKNLFRNVSFGSVHSRAICQFRFSRRLFSSNMKRCPGCGVQLQKTEKDKPGFVRIPGQKKKLPAGYIPKDVQIARVERAVELAALKEDGVDVSQMVSEFKEQVAIEDQNRFQEGSPEYREYSEEYPENREHLETSTDCQDDSEKSQTASAESYQESKPSTSQETGDLNGSQPADEGEVSPIKSYRLHDFLHDSTGRGVGSGVSIPILPEQSPESSAHGVLTRPDDLGGEDDLFDKKLVCVRCYQLTYNGKTKSAMDVDNTDFRKALTMLVKDSPKAAILTLVDVMDFYGTLFEDLSKIIGKRHPVIVCVNKIDVLPVNTSLTRVNKWVNYETNKLGLWVKEVLLVSAFKGTNMAKAVESLKSICGTEGRDLFVVGTTNVGKSTFINQLIKRRFIKNQRKHQTTISRFPGTTLGLIDFPLTIHPRNRLFDTPGMLSNTQLAPHLQFDELKGLAYSNPLKPRTYKVGAGQCIILGGLARVDMLSGRPFFFTTFCSPKVSVHIGRWDKVDDMLEKNLGNHLKMGPPFTPERFRAIKWSPRLTAPLVGKGWLESCVDVVFSGVGWMAVTGCGPCEIRAWGSAHADVRLRKPILPHESKKSYKKVFAGLGRP